MSRSTIGLDYETFSEAPLAGPSSCGLWNYMRDISTEALMVAYQIDDQAEVHVDLSQEPLPAELREALLDPEVEKWGFNSAFERRATIDLLSIDTPYQGWRCTMALANLQSFAGDLLQVGKAMGIDAAELKDKEGTRLIQLFSVPQKTTRKNSLYRRNWKTDPDDWQLFCDYNLKDLIAENSIRRKLFKFPIPDDEWELYELDQRINDRGLPVNETFVRQAGIMAERRRAELVEAMWTLTGLPNPSSTQQLVPWLVERGYPFADLQKATVKKVLTENQETPILHYEAVAVLQLRQQASRTSIKKYPAILRRLAADGRLRHCFQFAGAARTARWAGRGPQPHNLTITPPELEAEDGDASKLEMTAQLIEVGDYEGVSLMMAEPMTALAGSVRSSFQAEKDHLLVVCDLSAIESAVSAWLFDCKRVLRVFADGIDIYKDFGVELYQKRYEDITKAERTICKPAVLGCAYRLGAGELRDGKRTGLWGYAENMGVNITRDEAQRQVKLYREVYPELPMAWKALERAVEAALSGQATWVGGWLYVAVQGPFLTIKLPSERLLYYYKPRMAERTFEGKDGPYTRVVFSYMGQNQVSRAWGRVYSNGGKLLENATQAVARDVLALGMQRVAAEGFKIVGCVHDEIIAQVRQGDNYHTLELLRECMMVPIPWAKGLPLGAAGYVARIYRK